MSAAGADSGRTALLDACTLIPIRLTTTLLWLAEGGLFEVLWSDLILDEVERNLPKIGISREQAARRVATMRRAFGAAALIDDFEHLIPDMACDAKDRHVLAAAVRGEADTLVTFNEKDFPPESVDEHGIQVVHPDLFLLQLLAERPEEVVAALDRGTATLRKPPQTTREFLASLTRTVPMFANLAADVAASPPGPASPFPALVSADDDDALATLGEPGDPTNPAAGRLCLVGRNTRRSRPGARPDLRPVRVGRLPVGDRHAYRQVAGHEGDSRGRRAAPRRLHAVRARSRDHRPGVRGLPDIGDHPHPGQGRGRHVARVGSRAGNARRRRHPGRGVRPRSAVRSRRWRGAGVRVADPRRLLGREVAAGLDRSPVSRVE